MLTGGEIAISIGSAVALLILMCVKVTTCVYTDCSHVYTLVTTYAHYHCRVRKNTMTIAHYQHL